MDALLREIEVKKNNKNNKNNKNSNNQLDNSRNFLKSNSFNPSFKKGEKFSNNKTSSSTENENGNNHKEKYKYKENLKTSQEADRISILNVKSKLYEQLATDPSKDNEDNDYLVDFSSKSIQNKNILNKNEKDDLVEIIDEFGRSRHVSKWEASEFYTNNINHSEDSDNNRSNSSFTSKNVFTKQSQEKTIVGSVIQTEAFSLNENAARKIFSGYRRNMQQSTEGDKLNGQYLYTSRESDSPPPLQHYSATSEIRDKGVAFYSFSKDEIKRKEEMEQLNKITKESQDAQIKSLIEKRKEVIRNRELIIKNIRAENISRAVS